MNSHDLVELIREVKWQEFLSLTGKAESLFHLYLEEHKDEIRQFIINKLCEDLNRKTCDEIEQIKERRVWLKESS